jgi:hypothetical protein
VPKQPPQPPQRPRDLLQVSVQADHNADVELIGQRQLHHIQGKGQVNALLLGAAAWAAA